MSYPEKYERLWRDYLRDHEAWRLARSAYIQAANDRTAREMSAWTEARDSFSSQSPYSRATAFFGSAASISFFVIFLLPPLGLLGVLLFGGLCTWCKSADTNRAAAWERQNPQPYCIYLDESQPVPQWDIEHREPRQPELLHFHAPNAELTERDQAILHVFNHWPGYPPFWDYLKDVVRQRDNNHCQVAGCPSRVAIHVHHMRPTSQGGTHTPDNLVCLCAFHHGLEPQGGHERVWGDIKNRYFTLVRAHERSNRSGHGTHTVSVHVRRLQLVSTHDLAEINRVYAFACTSCGSSHLAFAVDEERREVDITCKGCGSTWSAKRALAEETGPRLAEELTVTRNHGRWQANWNMLAARNQSVFKLQNVHKHREGSIMAAKKTPPRKTTAPPQRTVLPGRVLHSIQRVTHDIATPLNAAAITHAHSNGWINDWEKGFYTSTVRKRTLSAKQSLKREQINMKILKRANVC